MQHQRFDPKHLDAGISAFLKDMAEGGGGPISAAPISDVRQLFAALAAQLEAPTDELASVTDMTTSGTDVDIPVRVYVPVSAQTNGGALVFYHGGGWTIGDLETHDALCRRLAHHSGAKVFSVEYRLAPENPFPAAIDDAMVAYNWVRTQAEHFEVDPKRIAVGGDSAGGNLAAVVSNQMIGTGFGPAFQLLIYPATQLIGSTLSREFLSEGYFLSSTDMLFFAKQYLPDMNEALQPKVSPLLQEDISGTPPTLLITAGFDPLCDEGMAYGEKLRRAGTTVEEIHTPSMIHGFFNFTALSPTALSIVEDTGRRLGEALKTTSS